MKRKIPQWLFHRVPLFLSSIIVTGLIFTIRYGGLLQSSELWALDQFFWLRSLIIDEKPDPRLVIVTIDEEDVKYQENQRWEVSDLQEDRVASNP